MQRRPGQAGGLPSQGRAAQVEPIKPMLTAPETKPLKLKHDEPVSIVAFKYNLRRYSEGLRGCPVNAEKAAFYYHMAGEAGDARGLARIGYLPVNGFGAAQASILGQPSVDIARHTSSNVFFCNC